MKDASETTDLYEALMALRPEGLSLSQWAQRAGINRSIFNGIRAHGNPTSATLQRLLDAIGADLTALYAHMPDRNPTVRTEVKATGMSARDVDQAWRGAQPQAPVPLLGSAFGGEWSDGVEMTELHLAEVLDYLTRPPSVASDKEAYAVEIVGDSMAPRFEPGERAFVSPRAPVRVGDDIIVQLKGDPALSAIDEGSLPDHEYAERVTMVLIKRLVKRTTKLVELRQFNPDQTFEVPVERIAAIHRVVGRL